MRGPGTLAIITTEGGDRFIVEQATRTRNAHGARMSEATLYEYASGRSKVCEVESDLYDTDVAVDSAMDTIRELTGDEIESIEDKR